ncbi:TonB-dependent receptor [Pontibacter sp. 172403-2]|uniref:SusC/RagA family TonB-linked outer membrane protein n=1 Tax=Pontibacter rufus TaxID=2791028 RepID=UPI0018AF9B59|nr:TonB-dependent receptor [Pontibacter sp. 172403-2]MBF9251955.1 TonB-dependent receptor [Pontibacter sp. 172403-2]
MKILLRFTMLALCLMIAQAGFAQSKTITGTVTSAEDGTALPGVSIVVKGTTNGVSAGADGTYAIQAAPGDVLVFSFIGMMPQEQTVGDANTIDVALAPDAKALEEVVVVGYGTQKRANLTGAVSTVDTKVLDSRPITDVARGLQGTTPGLTVTTSSGAIGQNPNIRLRGMTGTLRNPGAQPLILVDNVEIPSLQMVNPEDIESISVLKDAASSSIYGARGAWGVILITTKTGKRSSPVKVSYSNNFSWSTPTTTPEIAPAAEGAEMAFKALQRKNPNTNVFGVVGMYIDQTSIDKMREWEALYGGQDLGNEMVLGRDFEIRENKLFFYRPWSPGKMYMREWTPQQKHDVSVSGGSEKTNYYLGLGYLGQEGVLKVNPDNFDRYSLNVGVNTTVTDWFDVRAKVMYSKTEYTRPFYFSSETYDPWYYLYRWPAVYPYGTYEGHPFRSAITEVQQAKMNQEDNGMARINVGGTLRPFEGLTIDADYTYTRNEGHEHQTGGVLSAYNFWATGADLKYEPYSSASYNRVQYNSEWSNRSVGKVFATYEKDLNDHSFKVIAGGDAEVYDYWYQMSQKRNLMDPDRGEIDLATGDQFVDGARDKWANLGAFARLNYSYKDKYLLELNGRYDGSSRLSPNQKWAFFPSMSAGYVISEEPFMEATKPVLSFLKLRGSWGSIGNPNSRLGDIYRLMSSYSSGWLIGGVNVVTAATPGAFPAGLTWETINTIDFGLDSRFLNDKVGVTFDWYRRATKNMHSEGLVLPGTFGTGFPIRNSGELQNTGWELAVDFNHTFGNGINFSVTGTLTDFEEKIVEYADNKGLLENRPGRVIGDIWGFETDRFFTNDDFVQDADGNLVLDNGKYVLKDGIADQSYFESGWFFYGPGDIKYKDLNGDGKIDRGAQTVADHGDMKVIGNSTPHYQYGLRMAADWKGVDLSFFVQGVGKRDMWANGPLFIPGYRAGEAWYAHQLDYWTPENPNAYYPRPTDAEGAATANNAKNFLPQTKYLLNLAYMRMKNVTVGYTLPGSISNKVKIDRLRVYFSGENLFEFDNLDIPIDPEVDYTQAGLNDSNTFGRVYPYRRTFSCGLQATF